MTPPEDDAEMRVIRDLAEAISGVVAAGVGLYIALRGLRSVLAAVRAKRAN